MNRDEKVVLKVVGEGFVEKPKFWVAHRRSKNYLAHIVGLHPEYKFAREFIHPERWGRKSYFTLVDFDVGEYYELVCIYYTSSGKPRVEYQGFLRCISINDKEVILEPVDEETIFERFKDNNVLRLSAQRLLSRLKNVVKIAEDTYKAEVEYYSKLIRKLNKYREEIEELKRELTRCQAIEIPDVDKLREEAKKKIVYYALQLLKFGSRRKDVVKYKSNDVVIKMENGKLQYVNVKGAYVVSMYGNEPSFKNLTIALRILQEELMKYVGDNV